MLYLEEISKNENSVKILFEHLKNRKFNISHKNLPSYNDHKSFVLNHPYRKWFFVKKDNHLVGSVYIQYDNSIGINFDFSKVNFEFEEFIKKIYKTISPLKPKPSKVYSNFFVNVPILNEDLSKWLEEGGCFPSQISYEFPKKK